MPEPVEDRSHMNEPTIRDKVPSMKVPGNRATHRKGWWWNSHWERSRKYHIIRTVATVSDDRDPAFNKFPDIPQIECDWEDD